jgi:hypothetical protein
MKSQKMIRLGIALAMLVALVGLAPLRAQEPAAPAASASMTVTASVAENKTMPEIKPQDVVVQQGKQRLQVTDWVRAQGDHAGLDLFILIDDSSSSSLGSQLDDLRSFIKSQPSTTLVGVAYMRNAVVNVTQDLTNDRDAAAKALRLPLGSVGAYGSPYLSVIDLIKRWPEHPQSRREVIMVTDGIDRARGGPRWRGLTINPDVDSAATVAQRAGIIIHTIYTPGVGRMHRNFFEANNGQIGIAKLSDVTGGQSYFLGLQSPVSFKPYLDDLQKVLDNQYLLKLAVQPGKKAGLQYVSISTELAGVEFSAADALWVAGAGK